MYSVSVVTTAGVQCVSRDHSWCTVHQLRSQLVYSVSVEITAGAMSVEITAGTVHQLRSQLVYSASVEITAGAVCQL